MKSSKERKMDRKTKHKVLSVAKSEASHKRRLDNKAKRDAIHVVDPDMKVKIINQVTYNYLGTKIMVENGRIIKWLPQATPIPETVEVFEPDPEEYKKGRAIDNQIEKERLGVFNPFKWRKK